MATLHDVYDAAQVIAGRVVRTPLLPVPRLQDALGLEHALYLKLENFQRSRSFKERGATYAMSKLPEAARRQGVITRSSGNFAQALALAGQRLDVAVTVVMPTQAADFTRTWKTDKRTIGPAPTSVADGLLPPAVGVVNWRVLTKPVDAMATVSEAEIIDAMRLLYEALGIVAEPSGAVSLAGFIKAHTERPHAAPTVCMISGGNVDLARFQALLQQP